MSVPKAVLSSFETKDKLHPLFWKDEKKLNPKVRKTLLKVVNQFVKDWKINKRVKILDIRLTGSLAAFNYSKFSDIDLHVVINFEDVNKDFDLVDRVFTLIRAKWNNEHDVKIKNFEIEVYVEDDNEKHMSTGLYSVLDDKWLKFPKKTDVKVDKDDINTKAKHFFTLYDILVSKYEKGEYKEVVDSIKTVKKKIKKMRKSGLDKGGEFSTENLVFKVLRRTGLMGKFNKLLLLSTDKLLLER